MTIVAKELGKQYNRKWIFRRFNYTFESDNQYVILGNNGSGKSTLLRVISSIIEPDEGSLDYGVNFSSQNVYQKVNFVAPYIDLPEEFTLIEFLNFHSSFKKLELGYTLDSIIETCGLTNNAQIPIKEYSSGMKQRVKLAIGLFFKSQYIMLDEPCSHLDIEGYSWFHENLSKVRKDKIVLMASNDEREHKNFNIKIDIQEYK